MSTVYPFDPDQKTPERPAHLRTTVAIEIATIAVFYVLYSAARNAFGSAAVDPSVALDNAHTIIDVQRSLGLFFEPRVQDWFIGNESLIWMLNVFYGTFHFVVTAAVLLWLFVRHAPIYRRWRNTLAATTGLAIVGFSLFPVMPPRLLADCGPLGGCSGPAMVDTVAEFGGLWSFDSGAMESVSNQYAAVPSLHIAWALWCALALYPRVHNRIARVAIVAYPTVTFFTIVVTANHFWIDGLLGAATLAAGFGVAAVIARLADRRRSVSTGATRPNPVN